MSFVLGMGNQNFIVLCSEGRAKNNNDETVNEDYLKVFKTSNKVLIGMSGTIDWLAIALADILINDGEKFCLNTSANTLSYKNIKDKVFFNYQMINKDMYKEGEREAGVIIGGWNGDYMEMTRFSVFSSPDEKILTSDFFEILPTGGNETHRDNFVKYLGEYKQRKMDYGNSGVVINIRDIKNAFQDTMDEGMKFDNTINNHCKFCYIKKKHFM